jgi:Histidine ammonia-lyase
MQCYRENRRLSITLLYGILKNMNDVIIDGCSLSIPELVVVARHKIPVRLDPDAEERMRASRK